MKTQDYKIRKVICSKRKRKQLNSSRIYFTKRETRCLKLLLKGKTIREIATRLNLNCSTIYDCFYNIEHKTGCFGHAKIIKFIQFGKFTRRRRFIPNKNISLS